VILNERFIEVCIDGHKKFLERKLDNFIGEFQKGYGESAKKGDQMNNHKCGCGERATTIIYGGENSVLHTICTKCNQIRLQDIYENQLKESRDD